MSSFNNFTTETSFTSISISCFNLQICMLKSKVIGGESMEEKVKESSTLEKLTIALLIAALFIVVFNAVQFYKLDGKDKIDLSSSLAAAAVSEIPQSKVQASNLDVIPKGVPKLYGRELGVSFDDVSSVNPQKADATIKKVGVLDTKIELEGNDLKRYIEIVSKISCEYCCGADSIIFSDGKAACGCAHSFAMRGLAKYLIKYHPNDFTNDEILEELGKWKTLFFPAQLTQKAQVLKSKGIELNYINLASQKYRDIEKGAPTASGSMVGGC